MNNRQAGMAMLVFVNVMWGLSFIFSKTALSEGMPVMTLAFWRYLLTAVPMVPLCLKRDGGLRLGKEWAPLAFLTTMLGITVYFFFEYTGLSYTTASAASLILALVPMMTLLFRVLFQRKRISVLRWGAVALSLIGAYFVIMTEGEGAGSLKGNLLMICGCLCWTGYILATPKLIAACSSLRVTTWQAVCAVITFAPFAYMERAQWVAVSPMAWLCIFLLAIVCSAICYLLYNEAICMVDSLTVSLAININPIAACVGGALLLGERMTAMQLLGAALIIASMVVDTLAVSGAIEKKRA